MKGHPNEEGPQSLGQGSAAGSRPDEVMATGCDDVLGGNGMCS